MSTGKMAWMATVWIEMRRTMHRKLMIDQHRMWRTEGLVPDSVKIGLYISDQ
jgi:hypothetical protein